MLFDPYRAGDLSLANRMVMAPMTRCRADHLDAVPNDLMVEYYRQRASAGLILSEGVPVSDRARGYLHTGALWNEAQAAGWRRVNDAIHAAGGHSFAQLWHVGRVAHSFHHADFSKPAGPTARAANMKTRVRSGYGNVVEVPCEAPVALSTEEVKGVVKEFSESARLAKLAGFDGVEIHGANGYLLDQFRCPTLNDRTDEYGGSLENRYRLTLEVVDAAAAVFGPARVCLRQSPKGLFNDMAMDPDPLATYSYIAEQLQRRGIGFLHVFDQSCTWIHDPADPLLQALRERFRGALILCGGFDTADKAEAPIRAGVADLIAFGKTFIANPDLPRRLRDKLPLNPWDMSTFYSQGPQGYTDYPMAG